LIVDGDAVTCRRWKDAHRMLADALGDALAEWSIDLLGVHVVDRVAAGGRWHCADGRVYTGTVEDPTASPMAAAAVLDGRRLYSRRAELQEVIAVADPVRSATLAAAIDGCGVGSSDADARRDVELSIAAAGQVADGQPLSDDTAARLACALTDPL